MKSFEFKPRTETQIEQDKLRFIEAVENTSIEEIETEFDGDAAETLSRELKKSKLFLLGETHGALENPSIIYTLFKKFGFINLALEWDKKIQGEVENFLKTDEINFQSIKDSPDGRITAGHFTLIKKLKEEGRLEKLILFDQASSAGNFNDFRQWDERDANMAKNILTNFSDIPTLVVAGDLHTKTEAFILGSDSAPRHPMGENIKKEISNVPAGKISYLSGKYYNLGIKEFHKIMYQGKGKPRFFKNKKGEYIFELPGTDAAIVPNPHENL